MSLHADAIEVSAVDRVRVIISSRDRQDDPIGRQRSVEGGMALVVSHQERSHRVWKEHIIGEGSTGISRSPARRPGAARSLITMVSSDINLAPTTCCMIAPPRNSQTGVCYNYCMSTILLVEDETIIAETLRYNLEQEGYTVLTASDGVQALDLARTAHPDLVVLDVMLPRLNGFSVCRTLRQESAYRS